MQKSTGHILFWYTVEYFETPSGHIFEAPLTAGFDPDGYRQGAKAYVYREATREELLGTIQDIINRVPGCYDHIHECDRHLIQEPQCLSTTG